MQITLNRSHINIISKTSMIYFRSYPRYIKILSYILELLAIKQCAMQCAQPVNILAWLPVFKYMLVTSVIMLKDLHLKYISLD